LPFAVFYAYLYIESGANVDYNKKITGVNAQILHGVGHPDSGDNVIPVFLATAIVSFAGI
jgi:hypothetical protein